MSDVPDDRWESAWTLFNAGEFFPAHDVLEEIWSEANAADRRFYQGLIHAAVSLFHFGEANLSGARRMYQSTLRYLTPYLGTVLPQAIDLEQFLQDYRRTFAQLAAAEHSYPDHLRLDEGLLPQIRRSHVPQNVEIRTNS